MLSSSSLQLPKHMGHSPTAPRPFSARLCLRPLQRGQARPVTSILQIPLFRSNKEIILIKEIKNLFAFEF